MSEYQYFQKYKQKYLAIGGSTLSKEYETDDLYRLGKAYKNAYKVALGGGAIPLPETLKKPAEEADKTDKGTLTAVTADWKTFQDADKLEKYAAFLKKEIPVLKKADAEAKKCWGKIQSAYDDKECKTVFEDEKGANAELTKKLKPLWKNIESAAKGTGAPAAASSGKAAKSGKADKKKADKKPKADKKKKAR